MVSFWWYIMSQATAVELEVEVAESLVSCVGARVGKSDMETFGKILVVEGVW